MIELLLALTIGWVAGLVGGTFLHWHNCLKRSQRIDRLADMTARLSEGVASTYFSFNQRLQLMEQRREERTLWQ